MILNAREDGMDKTTLIIFLCMYVYGFSLTLWAIFLDKRPTPKSLKAAKWGLFGLLLTVAYYLFMFGTGRLTMDWTS
jgi:drug/metabolite transporter (DMT)-like permease